MNFYGSKEYEMLLESLDRQVFSRCDFSAPTDVKRLDDDYYVKRYYYADIENQEPYCAPVDGEICRLYKNDEFVFEWKNIDGRSRMISIIDHSDGNKYLLFDEDLYGYSVLNLDTLECSRYMPNESYGEDDFDETFIWCEPHYDINSNLLAVEGCFWAAPYSVIVLDFSEPMKIVAANEWIDLWEIRREENGEENLEDIDFVEWEVDVLKCTSYIINKTRLKEIISKR